MADSNCRAPDKTSRPIVPIVSFPQPLLPCKQPSNLSPHAELEIYKSQYSRLLRDNQKLLADLNRVMCEKHELEKKYNSLNVLFPSLQTEKPSNEERKKRYRRQASQIVREYECNVPSCCKSYGTEASLIQHIKLKHPKYFGTGQYAEHLCEVRKKAAQPETQVQAHDNQI